MHQAEMIEGNDTLFTWLGKMLTGTKGRGFAARDAQHTTHGNNLEFVRMVLHKGVLHFRLLAKYAAAFLRWPTPQLGLQLALEPGVFYNKPFFHGAAILRKTSLASPRVKLALMKPQLLGCRWNPNLFGKSQ